MKSRFARILDTCVLTAAVWLFSALALRYYLNEFYLVAIAATVVTLGVIFLVRLKSGKADEEKFFGAKTADFFLLKDEASVLEYFFNAFKTRYNDATINETSPFNQGFIRIRNTLVFCCMGEPLSLKRTVALYTLSLKEKAKTVVILCPSLEKNVAAAKARLNDIKLEIFTPEKTFRLLKSLNAVPEFDKKPYAEKMKEFFALALKPERSRGYLFTSVTLLMGAYFSQFWLYFLIVGSLCLSLALLSRLDILNRKRKV